MKDLSSLQKLSRRRFLKAATSAAAMGTVAAHLHFAEKAFATNGDTLKVGLIGCGGRLG
jgi:myo-inositol 2-dehydrogenase / D-chiro-inositol 1-dehydrogenase